MTWQNRTLTPAPGRSILDRPIVGRPMTHVLHLRAECLKIIEIAFRRGADRSGVSRQPTQVDDWSKERYYRHKSRKRGGVPDQCLSPASSLTET
jgi:hypothetical protein